MRSIALYLNGIFPEVLQDIARVQSSNPNFPLFLQPYSADPIRYLKDNPPDPHDPVTLYASTSQDLERVTYVSDIIRWEDKTTILQDKRDRIENILAQHQPTEHGLYNVPEDGISRNLLYVVRMRKLDNPVNVQNLIKTSDDKPRGIRTQPGGWSAVKTLDLNGTG